MNMQLWRYEVTECVWFLCHAPLCSVYSINLSTHWPFSMDVVCAVDNQHVQPQRQHSDKLID